MTFTVGDKSVSFTGREQFTPDDADLKAKLLAIGVFTQQPDGSLIYSGKVSVPLKDGTFAEVDPRGFLNIQMSDLATPTTTAFR